MEKEKCVMCGNETNENVIPPYIIDGYRIGAKRNDTINVNIPVAGITSTYSARIVIPNTQGTAGEATREKQKMDGRINIFNVISTCSPHSPTLRFGIRLTNLHHIDIY
jgi:hypothetical protein